MLLISSRPQCVKRLLVILVNKINGDIQHHNSAHPKLSPIDCDVVVKGHHAKHYVVHDDVIKWKHFPRYCPFMRRILLVTGEFPLQRLVMRSFDVFFNLPLSKQSIRWDLRRHCAHYDVTVMSTTSWQMCTCIHVSCWRHTHCHNNAATMP